MDIDRIFEIKNAAEKAAYPYNGRELFLGQLLKEGAITLDTYLVCLVLSDREHDI
jgi:hypothetical protein